jgi:hypothetical protein
LDAQEKALRGEIERSQSDYIHEKLFDEGERLGNYPPTEEGEMNIPQQVRINVN